MTTEVRSKQRQDVAEEIIASPSKIYDLPIEPLSHVASFLPLPSRALFAMSLATAHFSDNDISPTTFSREIIAAEGWETTLDFGSMEKDLAAKLRDEDVDAILRCIDAVNKVKILRLTNCINISGVGLEPLRGSEIIEKIDLTLVDDREVQRLHPKPPISLEHVLPILDSIIVTGSSLKHLQFPQHWRKDTSDDDSEAFNQFLGRFNQSMNSSECNRCAKCNVMEEEPKVEMYDHTSQDYGVQYRTCSVCTKHHCEGCCIQDDGSNYVYFCTKCERTYCSDCSEQYVCERCDKAYCVQCKTDMECSGSDCDVELCGHCRLVCLKCKKSHCNFCINEDTNRCIICDRDDRHCSACSNIAAEEQLSNNMQNNDDENYDDVLTAVEIDETTTQPATSATSEIKDGAMACGPTLSSTWMQRQQLVADNATTAAATSANHPALSNDSVLQNADTSRNLHPPAFNSMAGEQEQSSLFAYFTSTNPIQLNLSAAVSSSSTVASTVPPAQANSEAATSSSLQQTRASKRKKSSQGGRENNEADE